MNFSRFRRVGWTLALAGASAASGAARPARAQSAPLPAMGKAADTLEWREPPLDWLAWALDFDLPAKPAPAPGESAPTFSAPQAQLALVGGAPAREPDVPAPRDAILAATGTVPRVREAVPRVREAVPRVREAVPRVPRAGGTASRTRGVVLVATEVIAPTEGVVLVATETAPATQDATSVASETVPATSATAPATTQTVPVAPEAASATTTTAPPATTENPRPPTPEPILAPQVPAPNAPPRDLPIVSPPSTPATQITNPNVVLAPPPLANVPLAPGTTVATAPEGGPVGSDAGVQIPTDPNRVPATPGAPSIPPDATQIPSAPDTDIASGQEDPNGQFSLEAPGGVVFDQTRGLAVGQGQVTFRYRDLSVTGDRGLIDYNVNRATLAGNLTVSARGQSFQGKSLTFDLDTGRWLLSSIEKTFPPELFPPGTVLSPLYIRDGLAIGQGDSARGQNFKFSSCDRDDYYLKSNRIEFYRDAQGQPKRLVLRKNALYVLGQKILPLPVYVISLVAGAGNTRTPIQATFGQNQNDGYFVKSFYDLRATDKQTQSLLVDLLSKRGLGLGLQRASAGGGLLYLYLLSSKTGGRERNFTARQSNSLGQSIRSNFNFAGTRNNSLTGPGVSAQSGDLTLARNGKSAQTNAIFRLNRSNYGAGNSSSNSVSLDQRQNFGRGYSLAASGQFNNSSSSFGPAGATQTNTAQTADASLQLGKTSKIFDLFLRAELHPDLRNNRIRQLERLPELTLQSTTDRAPLPILSKYLPGNFTLGVGRFNEPRGFAGAGGQTVKNKQEDRADFFYNLRDRQYRLFGQGRSQTRFRANGNFEQAFYSDSSAQYRYGYNANLVNTLGRFTLQGNYFNTKKFGSTPFQFDFFNASENIDYTASYTLGQKLRLNLSGGSDLMNHYQRDLIFNAQFAPSQSFYGSLGTSYALENSNFGDIYGNFNVARNRNKFGGGTLAFGFRYNPGGRGLTQANASADVNLGKKTRVQALTSYNGFTQKFDFTQIRVIQDLHCFNLYANYDNQRKQIRFDLALKAFPFVDTRFGRNVFSEGFDSSVGINR